MKRLVTGLLDPKQFAKSLLNLILFCLMLMGLMGAGLDGRMLWMCVPGLLIWGWGFFSLVAKSNWAILSLWGVVAIWIWELAVAGLVISFVVKGVIAAIQGARGVSVEDAANQQPMQKGSDEGSDEEEVLRTRRRRFRDENGMTVDLTDIANEESWS